MQARTFLFLQLGWIFLGMVSRFIPHLPNATGMILATLLCGVLFSPRGAILSGFGIWIISDVVLAFLTGESIWGSWTFFTYSSVAGFLVLSQFQSGVFSPSSYRPLLILSLLIGGSLSFWIWTNFGTWLFSSLYHHDMAGFMTCYTFALPFLKNQLIGDVILGLLYIGSYNALLAYDLKQPLILGIFAIRTPVGHSETSAGILINEDPKNTLIG